MSSQKSVLEYVEETPRGLLKQVVTVKRTKESKYLFYLLVRHYSIELRKKPTFMSYSKTEAQLVRGTIEEISLFGSQDLFVLEGFPLPFVQDLSLPKGVFVLAEVDDGELEAPAYSYRQKRGILKAVSSQLGLKVSLRDLVSLDWGGVRDYPEIEGILRKAAAAGWGLSQIEELLKGTTTGNTLLMLKKGNQTELLQLKAKYGDAWFTRNLTRLISQMATYRALVAMGQTPTAIAEELGLSNYRLREFEEAAKAVTMSDLKVLATRVLDLDRMGLKWPNLASDLLVLKSGISIKR